MKTKIQGSNTKKKNWTFLNMTNRLITNILNINNQETSYYFGRQYIR